MRRAERPLAAALWSSRSRSWARRGDGHARTSTSEIAVADFDVGFSHADANPLSEDYGDLEALRRAIEPLPRDSVTRSNC